jgi:hypothetical protein
LKIQLTKVVTAKKQVKNFFNNNTGCLKRYCDCFQNGTRCTNLCKCVGCKNYNGSSELNSIILQKDSGQYRSIKPEIKKISNKNGEPFREPFKGLINDHVINKLSTTLMETCQKDEILFTEKWNSMKEENVKTPPPFQSEPIKPKLDVDAESLLLCNEEDAFDSTKETSNHSMFPNSDKGFEVELQISLEKSALTQFKFLLKQLLSKVHSNSLNMK